MAKAKSTGKKAAKTAKKTTKGKVAPSVKAAAKKAPPVKAAAKPAPAKAPTKAAAPAKVAKPSKPAAKPEATEGTWTDTIKAALERRHQQPDYPGSGSNSWKRAKH
jgi:hypothetical protein